MNVQIVILDVGIKKYVGGKKMSYELTAYEKKYYKLLIGKRFTCYDITLNELLIIMNSELYINTLSIQKSGRYNFCCKVDNPTKLYYLKRFGLLKR